MKLSEYVSAQTMIGAAVVSYVTQFGKLFAAPMLSVAEWLRVLEMLFPEVQRQRIASAELARRYYDAERAKHLPGRHDHLISPYEFEDFVRNMDPVRPRFSAENATEKAIGALARRAVREVENGGRQQIIKAVRTDNQQDPNALNQTRTVKGWARVATGAETCAWCLMLVSRGPVYLGADTAGLNLGDSTAKRMIAAGLDVSDDMEQWHDGCDCKVVPVFDKQNWPGKAAADRALELWNEASKEAQRELDEMTDAEREKVTLNNRAINALRRRLYRDEIDPAEWAALMAA
ncbi:hypothetical protein GS454_01385 [Rhodococcus hoagii]|nr:hypothetical protein [Prescottella equi]